MLHLVLWNRSAAASGVISLPSSGTPRAKSFTAYYWDRNVAILAKQPGAIVRTYTVNGKPPAKGELFRNPDLAHTYRLLAEQGRDAFYKGEIAEKIDAFSRANGGYLRKEDFAAHQSEWVEPISTNYRGYDVCELPPNTQGVTTLEMLNILEGYDLKTMGFGSADALHVMIEAKKLAFEDRARSYGDPRFSQAPGETAGQGVCGSAPEPD